MKFWRVASLTLIGLGALYIISDLVFDFLGIRWFILPIRASATMIYGCLCVTWGVIIWIKFSGK